MINSDRPTLIESARADAAEAAASSPVRIDLLRTPAQAASLVELFADIWRVPVSHPPIDLATVTALVHGHGYVSGAFRDHELVGASVALVVGDRLDTLHSHITGVRDDACRRGVAAALKLHQRWWALSHDISTVSWTFDPLIGRNARFNLHRLGARLTSYLIDFYGPMTDGRNQGQPSDRAFVRWDLRLRPSHGRTGDPHESIPLLTMDGSGRPQIAASRLDAAVRKTLVGSVELIIPADIEAIRGRDLELALAWRLALRETLAPLLASGWQVSGYEGKPELPTGSYFLLPAVDSVLEHGRI